MVSVGEYVKAGVHLNAVFWMCIMALAQISRSRFKHNQKSLSSSHISTFRTALVLKCFGDFYN